MTAVDLSAIVTIAVMGSGGIAAMLHFGRKYTRKVDLFLSDWNGEPARPGVPEKRGVMVRLDKIEAEISYNHGSSIKDAVHRIDQRVADLITNSPH